MIFNTNLFEEEIALIYYKKNKKYDKEINSFIKSKLDLILVDLKT
jgi:hypothetical protein